VATYPSFLEYHRAVDPLVSAADARCIAVAGTNGCGWEQPLEAVLKSITPSTCADPWCTFAGGTRGHGDRSNAGFARVDSLLGLVLLTDEDDCSIADRAIFDLESTRYAGEVGVRCFLHPEARHAVSRYVDGYLATRSSPSRLLYTVIAGVPPGTGTESSTHEELLALPQMQEQLDPSMPARIRPSCEVEGRGLAFPPRRLVEVARELDARGATGLVYSICEADLSPAIDGIIETFAAATESYCLSRAMPRDEAGLIACEVTEALPPGVSCASIPGRSLLRVERDERGEHERCLVAQLPLLGDVPPSEPGWFYDTTDDARRRCSGGAGRVAFTRGQAPHADRLLRFVCMDEQTCE
jgi:hypothetical protein